MSVLTSDRALASALGIGGVGMLVASTLLTPHRVAGPLGVEAGFTVVLLAYLFARYEYGFRNALVAMMAAVGAQLTVLLRHDATFAWLGAELVIAAALELAWLGWQALVTMPAPFPVVARVPVPRRATVRAAQGRESPQAA